MAEKKNADDAGQAEVQKKVAENEEKGYQGVRPAGPDDAEYALTSGPESPTATEVAEQYGGSTDTR